MGQLRARAQPCRDPAERAVRLTAASFWAASDIGLLLIDISLLFVIVEAIWLTARRGVPAIRVVLALLPGALLMLGLRAALAGAAWPWVVALLTLSLPAHFADLAARGWLRGRVGG